MQKDYRTLDEPRADLGVDPIRSSLSLGYDRREIGSKKPVVAAAVPFGQRFDPSGGTGVAITCASKTPNWEASALPLSYIRIWLK